MHISELIKLIASTYPSNSVALPPHLFFQSLFELYASITLEVGVPLVARSGTDVAGTAVRGGVTRTATF